MKYREDVIPIDRINQTIGIQETADNIATLLTKMCLKSVASEDGTNVKVEIPPTRAGQCKNNIDYSLSFSLSL